MRTLNWDFATVANTQGKEISRCIKKFGNLKLDGSVEDCLTADHAGRVARAEAKTDRDFSIRCSGTDIYGDPKLPPFGVTDPNTINVVAIEQELALSHAIFGPDLDTALIQNTWGQPFGWADNRLASRYQHVVVRAVMKCRNARLTEWKNCSKAGLKDGSITDAATLWSSCQATDLSGRVARACDPISSTLRRHVDRCNWIFCGNMLDVFPGCLGMTYSKGQVAECLDFYVECHVCLALAEAHDLDPSVCADNCVFQGFDPCGNTWLAADEECDDGNFADGDGCSSECVCNPATTPAVCNLSGDWNVVGEGETLTFIEDGVGDSTVSGTLLDDEFTGQGSRSDSCGTGTATARGDDQWKIRFTVGDGCDAMTLILKGIDFWGGFTFALERVP